ncbi:MAG: YciI family protein [Alphaproteobacteria bacterium]|tara:strand:+ start:300 stop:575 length:276 start_codon:yes stop_codon:yes gene_type:complete
MRTYIVICKDKKNSLKKRLENRKMHLDHLKKINKQVLLAGPMMNKNQSPKGSVLILNFENKEKLKKFLKADPYVKAGLFEEITIENFKRVL